MEEYDDNYMEMGIAKTKRLKWIPTHSLIGIRTPNNSLVAVRCKIVTEFKQNHNNDLASPISGWINFRQCSELPNNGRPGMQYHHFSQNGN